jgi:hypothetical protein
MKTTSCAADIEIGISHYCEALNPDDTDGHIQTSTRNIELCRGREMGIPRYCETLKDRCEANRPEPPIKTVSVAMYLNVVISDQYKTLDYHSKPTECSIQIFGGASRVT